MYDQEALKDFKEQFNEVFNDKGEIKACGRDACKKLINLAEKLDKEGKPYGDHKDGYIDIPKMLALYKKLNK